MAEQTQKRSMATDDETEIETKVRSKTHLQLQIITTGAAKDNVMKIFEITILNKKGWETLPTSVSGVFTTSNYFPSPQTLKVSYMVAHTPTLM